MTDTRHPQIEDDGTPTAGGSGAVATSLDSTASGELAPAQQASIPGSGFSLRAPSRKFYHRYGVVIVWAVVICTFALIEPSTFLTVRNFESMFGLQSTALLLALALVITLSVGEFDLSVASILGLSATATAVLNAEHGWPILAAVAVGLAIGAGAGVLNGLIVVYLDVDSIVVTLGTGTLMLGIALLISHSTAIGGVSTSLTTATLTMIGGWPLVFFYSIACVLAIWYIQSFTALGRHMLFVGQNRDVAKLAGVRVDRVRFGAYIMCGLLASFTGIMTLGIGGGIEADSTQPLLLPAFAAAFLGAAVIRPGRFNAWGTLVAVYFLITGITGLELMGLSGWIEQVFYGGALVVAVTTSRLLARSERAA